MEPRVGRREGKATQDWQRHWRKVWRAGWLVAWMDLFSSPRFFSVLFFSSGVARRIWIDCLRGWEKERVGRVWRRGRRGGILGCVCLGLLLFLSPSLSLVDFVTSLSQLGLCFWSLVGFCVLVWFCLLAWSLSPLCCLQVQGVVEEECIGSQQPPTRGGR
ncbi:hypothetical protein VTJ04DRAFT_6601 [Mycothermus thermophilus]|uniref:uncharacterized protein n=1 Tax=Humicola insolens TaxID=85995 RepID=UPI0037443F98